MRYLSLFSGCGLLDLGLDRAGWVPVMFCERDKHCRTVLARHWPGVPVVGDVREVAADTDGGGFSVGGECDRWTGESGLAAPRGRDADGRDATPAARVQFVGRGTGAERVDLVAGGFPCTDLSYAGRRAGLAGDHSGLWYEMARVIRRTLPRLVLVENVPGLLAPVRPPGGWPVDGERVAPLAVVLADLAEAGYDAWWASIRASDVGAPHKRERVFIVAAHTGSAGAGRNGGTAPVPQEQAGRGEPRHADAPQPRREAPADADDGRCEQRHESIRGVPVARPDSARVEWGAYDPAIRRWEQVMGAAPAPTDEKGRLDPRFVEWMMGAPDGWTDGTSRTQRLKMLGNGVQVQVGELLGHAMKGVL